MQQNQHHLLSTVGRRIKNSSRVGTLNTSQKALLSYIFLGCIFCLFLFRNRCMRASASPCWDLVRVSFEVEFAGSHPVRAACYVWRRGADYRQSHQLFNEHRDLFLWKWVFPWKLWKLYPGLFKWGNMGKVSTTTWALFSQFKVRREYFALQSHSSGRQYSGGGVAWGRGDRK